MKSLLNITVLVSSVLSIFSTSLALYDLPGNQKVPLRKEVQQSNSKDDMKRIYISHDVSKNEKGKDSPLLLANKNKRNSIPSEQHINVFGVKIPNKNT